MFLKYHNKLHEQKSVPVSGTLTLLLIFINALILKEGYIHHETLNPLLFITMPLLFFLRSRREANPRSNGFV